MKNIMANSFTSIDQVAKAITAKDKRIKEIIDHIGRGNWIVVVNFTDGSGLCFEYAAGGSFLSHDIKEINKLTRNINFLNKTK